ncbi:hypothetical protein TNCV_2765231 [Trichonephila clavipes]|nr:hypothetical protein TNCV_2765231 [Trichonephila clavipes]
MGELWIVSNRSILILGKRRNQRFYSAQTEENSSDPTRCPPLHTQWIPSHVNIRGNEVAGRERETGQRGYWHFAHLSRELHSNARSKLNLTWRIYSTYTTMVHRNMEIKCGRGSQTALARLISGHLKCLSYNSGRKIYPTLVRNTVTIQLHRITFVMHRTF